MVDQTSEDPKALMTGATAARSNDMYHELVITFDTLLTGKDIFVSMFLGINDVSERINYMRLKDLELTIGIVGYTDKQFAGIYDKIVQAIMKVTGQESPPELVWTEQS